MAGKDSTGSWVVLASATYIYFLETGILKGFSVLLPDLREQFRTKTWIVGSYISIIITWGYVLGLSASALVKKFGPRFCLMFTGLVSSVGLIACACATSVYMLLPGLILVGFLLLQANIAAGIIPDYFEKHYRTAVSIYCCGTALGIVIMPVLAQMFLDSYGWRGALVLFCGLNVHSIPCAALLKRRQILKTETPLLLPSNNLSTSNTCEPPGLAKMPKIVWKWFINSLTICNQTFITQCLLPAFVCGYTLTGWMIYIVSFALFNGISKKESSNVATCGGVGLLLIRATLPILHKLMTSKRLMYSSAFIMAASIFVTSLMNSLIGMFLSSGIFGIGVGMLGAEVYIVAESIVDSVEYITAIGCIHFVYGLAAILSGTLAGLIFDVTGSFMISFAILSAVSSLAAASLAFEDIWVVFNGKNK